MVEQLRPPLVRDPVLVTVVVLLVAISFLMLYSVTGIQASQRLADPWYFLKRQGMGLMLGGALLVGGARMSPQWWRTISPLCLVACYALLLLPLIPGLGERAGGAQRWINLGPVRFQPGEFVKVLFLVYICGYYARHEGQLKSFVRGILVPLAVASSVGALLLVQPDFGSTVVVFAVTLLVGAVSGVRIFHLGLGAAGAAVAAVALVVTSPYRMKRIAAFLNPWEDIGGRGYQLFQSLVAVGSGKVFGVGLGESQQKLFFLPAAHTDFIFAVVAEELGLIGCLAVISLFTLFLWRGLYIALTVAHDTFCFALAVAMTLLVVFPAVLNMGVVTGLLPTKGMVLPLFGYGGSSLMATLFAIGILLSVSKVGK